MQPHVQQGYFTHKSPGFLTVQSCFHWTLSHTCCCTWQWEDLNCQSLGRQKKGVGPKHQISLNPVQQRNNPCVGYWICNQHDHNHNLRLSDNLKKKESWNCMTLLSFMTPGHHAQQDLRKLYHAPPSLSIRVTWNIAGWISTTELALCDLHACIVGAHACCTPELW